MCDIPWDEQCCRLSASYGTETKGKRPLTPQPCQENGDPCDPSSSTGSHASVVALSSHEQETPGKPHGASGGLSPIGQGPPVQQWACCHSHRLRGLEKRQGRDSGCRVHDGNVSVLFGTTPCALLCGKALRKRKQLCKKRTESCASAFFFMINKEVSRTFWKPL